MGIPGKETCESSNTQMENLCDINASETESCRLLTHIFYHSPELVASDVRHDDDLCFHGIQRGQTSTTLRYSRQRES